MTAPFPPDRISEALSKWFAGMQVPATRPDASAVKPPMQPVAQRTIGPASTPSNLPQPMGGVMGALMSAGPVGERMLRDARDHPFASVAEMTGIPSIYRGVRDQDVGSIAHGAIQALPFMSAAGRGLGALASAAPEAAQLAPAAAEAAAIPASSDERVSAALREVASNKWAAAPGNVWTRTPEMMAMREERRKLMSIPRAGGRRAGDAAAVSTAEANPFVERASRMADSAVVRSMAEPRIARLRQDYGDAAEAQLNHQYTQHLPAATATKQGRYILGYHPQIADEVASEFAAHPNREKFVNALREDWGDNIPVYRAGEIVPGRHQSFTTDPAIARLFSATGSGPVGRYTVSPRDVAFPGLDQHNELVIDGAKVRPR